MNMKQPEVIVKENEYSGHVPKKGNVVISKNNREFILLIVSISVNSKYFNGVYIGKDTILFGSLYENRYILDYQPFKGEITFKI